MKTRLLGNFPLLLAIFLAAACGGRCDKRSQDIQMRFYRLVNCIILSVCMSGCAHPLVYPVSFSRDDHKTETRKDLAESLIGESQKSVIEKIGLPNQLLTDRDQKYMIYEHQSTANEKLMLFFILPAGYLESDDNDTLHCLKIDLDANNLVVDYQFKSTAYFERYVFFKCPREYWKEEEWQSIEELPVSSLFQQPSKELKEGASWPNYGPPGSGQ
jgi:hypothetical protein